MPTFLRLFVFSFFLALLWAVGAFVDNQTHDGELNLWSVLALAALVAVWALALLFAVLPAVSLYSPQSNSKFNFGIGRYKAIWNPSKITVIGYVATSYGMTIYLFSVIFVIISNYERNAFGPAIETLGTAVYFSIVTIATVGYGDIQPVSSWARFAASTEILIGVAYSVFFLSVIAGFLREQRAK